MSPEWSLSNNYPISLEAPSNNSADHDTQSFCDQESGAQTASTGNCLDTNESLSAAHSTYPIAGCGTQKLQYPRSIAMTGHQPNLAQTPQNLVDDEYYLPLHIPRNIANSGDSNHLDEFAGTGSESQRVVDLETTSTTGHSAPIPNHGYLATASAQFEQQPDTISSAPALSALQTAMTADSEGMGSLERHRSQDFISPQQPTTTSTQRVGRPKNHAAAFHHTRAKQETRVRNGSLEHRVDKGEAWHPAVKHSAIFDILLQEAERTCHYLIPQATGIDPGDKTARVADHRAWGPVRVDRPAILFQLLEIDPTVPVCILRPFRYQGRRVLDRLGKWMTDWDDVPVTCSSAIEGWYIEALMRRNPTLTYWDILARMRDEYTYRQKNGHLATRAPGRSSTLTQRTRRFRERSFNVPWRGSRADSNSNALCNLVLSMLPKHIKDANSTYGHRDPSREETKRMQNVADAKAQQDNSNNNEDAAEAGDLLLQEVAASSSGPSNCAVGARHTVKRLHPRDIMISEDDYFGTPHAKRQELALRDQSINRDNRSRRSGNEICGDPDSVYSDERIYSHDYDHFYADPATGEAIKNVLGHSHTLLLASQIPTGSRASLFPRLAVNEKRQPQVPRQLFVADHESPKCHYSSGLNSLHGFSEGLSTDLKSHMNSQMSQGLGGIGFFDTNGSDIYSKEGEYQWTGFRALDHTTIDQSQEPQQDSSAKKSMSASGFADIQIEVGKTYIIVCLNNAVATKCHVATHDNLVPNKLELQELRQEIDGLKQKPLSWRSKAILRESPDSNNLEPKYSVLQLPTDKEYIIVCIQERMYHKAIAAEGDETVWAEIDYAQLVEDVSASRGQCKDIQTIKDGPSSVVHPELRPQGSIPLQSRQTGQNTHDHRYLGGKALSTADLVFLRTKTACQSTTPVFATPTDHLGPVIPEECQSAASSIQTDNVSLPSFRNDFPSQPASLDWVDGCTADNAVSQLSSDSPFGADTDHNTEEEAIDLPDQFEASQLESSDEPLFDDALIDEIALAMVERGELKLGDLFDAGCGSW